MSGREICPEVSVGGIKCLADAGHTDPHWAPNDGGGSWRWETVDWAAEQAALDELERTDPDVAAAAPSYDRMVKKMTGRNSQHRNHVHAPPISQPTINPPSWWDDMAREMCEQVNVWDILAVIDDEDGLVDALLPVIRKHVEKVTTTMINAHRSWLEGKNEADNDTDRWYCQGRADAYEQAALRLEKFTQ